MLQILVLILKDHDWVIESTKNMLKCNFVYYEEKEENVHIYDEYLSISLYVLKLSLRLTQGFYLVNIWSEY